MKSSTYYFHIKAKTLPDFQICISVPLNMTEFWLCVRIQLWKSSKYSRIVELGHFNKHFVQNTRKSIYEYMYIYVYRYMFMCIFSNIFNRRMHEKAFRSDLSARIKKTFPLTNYSLRITFSRSLFVLGNFVIFFQRWCWC